MNYTLKRKTPLHLASQSRILQTNSVQRKRSSVSPPRKRRTSDSSSESDLGISNEIEKRKEKFKGMEAGSPRQLSVVPENLTD